ncbi:hypothetical protein KY348_05160 [Candidatus Woesearchaeota archaeon]|nr:hypothetical protein [Candidatus Woesearchaeota archaeon]
MAEKRGDDAGSSTSNKLILKKAVHKRIKQIESKAFVSEREIYDLIRGFFKKYLGVDYEFTHEELIKELRKVYLSREVQEKVNDLFHKISEIEHTSKAFPREHLEQILAEFKVLVDELIVSHYEKEKAFFRKIRDSLHKLFSRKHHKMLEVDESILSEHERIIVKMNMLLDNSKRLIDRNLEESKKIYQELTDLYNSLDESRKQAYFKPVQELYNMIRSKGG